MNQIIHDETVSSRMSVIDFRQNQPPNIPKWILEGSSFKLMLWAGDGCHDGASDVERLQEYDIYLCQGYPDNLDVNIKYLKERGREGCICLLDIFNEHQMTTFIGVFSGKISHINSDIFGNTPTLPLIHYKALLESGGTAYNTIGINCAIFPEEEYYDTLELFAPVLSDEVKQLRIWSRDIISLAKDNDLSPAATWSSPDIKHPYYEPVIQRQNKFIERQIKRNPSFNYTYKYNSDNFEEYLDTLPSSILTANIGYAIKSHEPLKVITPHLERFYTYLKKRIMADGRLTFDASMTEDMISPQSLLTYLDQATAIVNAGLKATIGPYHDTRIMKQAYGVILSKE